MEVKLSRAAVESASATMSSDLRVRTDREKEYDAAVASCVRKAGGHNPPAPDGTSRLYTVTTIASSPRYGGTRTPAVCDSFERAAEIVESNEGDIWEHSYMLVVVEAVVPNRLYGSDLGEQWWWRWCGADDGGMADGRYVAVEVPEAYASTTGFAVG